ncbi:MAG: D-alanyl-D-alanine carboxypeptidase family protein [Clostridiales bacterium]|jgi:D-alanyl-D-alanine dipeptidase|nr:D-alanyl-D-alanine carboxypeptidase family protein [Clostridiales bacterium]
MKMVEVVDKNIITYSPQYLREAVFDKLVAVAKNAPTPIVLHEGWRSLEKQTKMFNAFKQDHPEMTDEQVHKFVAIPEKAIHVTGGAVDVTLQNYDMGTDYLCFDGRQKTDYYINAEVAANRELLCGLMLEQGFVNFYNEWWHFEYGTRMWAKMNDCEQIFDIVEEAGVWEK